MKNNLKNAIKLLIAITGFAALIVSCNYQQVADADYPAPKLYMPTAANGIYLLDTVSQHLDFLPTPGQSNRFTTDASKNKLIVPLGVYRSGINRSGKLTASIISRTDTISALIDAAAVPEGTTIFPSGKFTIPDSVDIPDGSEFGTFNLEIDLDFLKGLPNTTIGIGISISSNDAEVNPLLNTTVILIDTKIL